VHDLLASGDQFVSFVRWPHTACGDLWRWLGMTLMT
jgi:hypothetical protein